MEDKEFADYKYHSMKRNKYDDRFLTPHMIHNYTIIWMDGINRTAEGHVPLFAEDKYGMVTPEARVILLNPQEKFVSFYNARVRNWYNIKYIGNSHHDAVINEEQLEEHTTRVKGIIDREVKLLNGNYSKIMVGGFGEGACIAYNTFLKTKKKLGGIIALSGHCPPSLKISGITDEQKKVPIFSFHGDEDEVIPETVHRYGANLLKIAKCNIKYKTAPRLDHKLTLDIIEEVGKFIPEVQFGDPDWV